MLNIQTESGLLAIGKNGFALVNKTLRTPTYKV